MENRVTESYNYNVICKVCGWKLKAADAKRRWDGLEPVCPVTCWEPRHPLDFYKGPKSDFHKLPYTNADTMPTWGGYFPRDYLPDDINWGSNASAVHNGTLFTALVDGYLSSIRVYAGGDNVSGAEAQYHQYRVAVYLNSSGALLWSKWVTLLPNRWNDIPITPNLAVTESISYMATLFRPAGSYVSFIAQPTHPAQTYLQLVNQYNNVGVAAMATMPATLDVANTILFEAVIRPT